MSALAHRQSLAAKLYTLADLRPFPSQPHFVHSHANHRTCLYALYLTTTFLRFSFIASSTGQFPLIIHPILFFFLSTIVSTMIYLSHSSQYLLVRSLFRSTNTFHFPTYPYFNSSISTVFYSSYVFLPKRPGPSAI